MTCGVIADPRYGSWWGEGEVNVFLDGDGDWPTLVGTGLENYIGDAWGLKAFALQYSGCPIADGERGHYNLYRWHMPDPIWFDEDSRVTIEQIGCAPAGDRTRHLAESGLPFQPTLLDKRPLGGTAHRLLDEPEFLQAALTVNEGAVHYYRVDDYASCALFYLDKPASDLPALAPYEERIAGLVKVESGPERLDL